MYASYVTESASHAYRWARRLAAQNGFGLWGPPAMMEVEPQRLADTLKAMGPGYVLVTWHPLPGGRKALYKVFVNFAKETP